MSPFLKSLAPIVRNLAVSLLPEMDPAILMKIWTKLQPIPGGKLIFSELLGKVVPYTGTVSPTVMELAPGNCLVVMSDRTAVRNHLKSVHAMALANLGECASGLALLSKLPPTHHGILVGFRVEYLKKARGTLTSRGSVLEWKEISGAEDQVALAAAEIRNSQQEVVARCFSDWKVSPKDRMARPPEPRPTAAKKSKTESTPLKTRTQNGSKPKKGKK